MVDCAKEPHRPSQFVVSCSQTTVVIECEKMQNGSHKTEGIVCDNVRADRCLEISHHVATLSGNSRSRKTNVTHVNTMVLKFSL